MNIIDRQNVITIFLEAAVDPVGLLDRTKDSTNENYDEDLCSENPVEAFAVKPVTRSSPARVGSGWSVTEPDPASCTSTSPSISTIGGARKTSMPSKNSKKVAVTFANWKCCISITQHQKRRCKVATGDKEQRAC